MYLNKAIVYGNLTRDPELKSLPSGIQVCSFSIATNRTWKDKNGARQEASDFHNIVVFGRQGETSAQYLRKGSSAMIEGRMQTRSWDTPNGEKKYRTEIIADNVQFGPRAGGPVGPSSAPTSSAPSAPSKAAEVNDVPPIDTIDYPEENVNLEDIPF